MENIQKMEVEKLYVLKITEKCIFCGGTEVDEINYGPIYKYKNIITHFYCLLLSPNLIQNSTNSEEGLLGFLEEDIIKEVRRGSKLTCRYCKKKGATLGCNVKKCKAMFHLPCGIKNGTLHQFYGDYQSFCSKHRPIQDICPRSMEEAGKSMVCVICFENVVADTTGKTLWAPCCRKNAFFHQFCVQNLALNAGYSFRCPLCNNEDLFKEEMTKFGVFIPQQDAAWECEPNAYEELLVRHNTCDSVSCRCLTGRDTDRKGTKWELILCKFCGSQGMHIGCGGLNKNSPEFTCNTCSGTHYTRQGN